MKFKKIKPSEFAKRVFEKHGHKSRRWVEIVITEDDHPDYHRQNGLIVTKCGRCGVIFEYFMEGTVFVRINGQWRATYLKNVEDKGDLLDEEAIHNAMCDDLVIESVIT